ncbi:hypothetical protein A2U01_0100729, partial [Trifolium medium]|nr:hypothetical protein [Trifolium medium]
MRFLLRGDSVVLERTFAVNH